ncbi:Protoporphyrinogen oxidase, partial [Stegodyphus mimosarum]
MATVAIIGGGISGLSCAYYLKTLGHHKIRYMFLLEKNLKFGGWIQTTRFPDGAVFEHGPRTIRVGSKSGYNAIALADELNLASRILPVTKNHSLAKTNYILSNNELYPLPRDFKSMLAKTPPFSKALFLYGLKEMWTKKSEIDDESVYSFVERRVGQEIADFVFDPLCRGIAAGDARELSVRSMFPSLYEGEQQHGSFVKSLLKSRHDQPMFEYMYSDLVKKSCSEMWRSWTFKTGLSEIIDALACTIEERGGDILFNAECSKLTFKDNK